MRVHVLFAQHLVHARHEAVGGVGEVLQRGGLGGDDRDLVLVVRHQARRVRAAAAELDEGRAGQAVLRDLRVRVGLDRRVAGDAHLGDDLARVVGRQAQVLDRAHGDAVVADAAAFEQAGHRLVEDDAVGVPFALGGPVRRPQREQQAEDADRQREGADQDVVGLGFHAPLLQAIVPASRIAGGAGTRTVEIFLHPRVVETLDLLDGGIDHHALVGEHRDAVADRVQRVEVVRDQEHRQAQRLLQGEDQLVERGRADGVQARGGFVEEQQRRIQRERARQARALAHAAGELRRQLVDRVGRQAGELHLQQREFVAQRIRQLAVVLLQRHLHVLADGERREQRAVLEQHAGVAFDVLAVVLVFAARVDAEHFDRARVGRRRPMIERISTDLPAPDPPTTPRISPRRTSRSRPSCTTCSPKRFVRPRRG